MQNGKLINANPATIISRLYQIKAEQDGRDITIVAHAERRELPCDAEMDMTARRRAVAV